MEKDVTPDLGSCLLHQKLQMLQFCIETKRKQHAQLDKSNAIMCASSSSGSDIFYDANEEEASTEQQPKGRLQPMEEYLLDKPDEHIYVPITQDKGPLTDDMLEALTKHLTSQTANDRVKEQLDVLLSDMQAFKAANPGARMEDFIRWHSPRDWVCSEEDGEEGLSDLLLIQLIIFSTLIRTNASGKQYLD
jgi:Rab3 GTPase-activating protein catalytic subunit